MHRPVRLMAIMAVAMTLGAAACGGDTNGDGAAIPGTTAATAPDTTGTVTATEPGAPVTGTCDAVVATLRTVTSANPELPDPESQATCEGDTVQVTSNAIPDYVYVQTSPGTPTAQSISFEIPAEPTDTANPTDVALLGPVAVAVNGVPIYGPTEATGGDVLSLVGALSQCGSHNGPTGFHIHLFGWAQDVNCLYSADEVEAGQPLVVGWSFDGYPIMSGSVCVDDACSSTRQLQSSWQLTDSSLFATDTWAAHSYVAGSGDLDQCNGRVDSDGQYRYYTTPTFPYVLGCYTGAVSAAASAGATGGPPGGGPPPVQ